jgi:hypothetical protein
MPLVDLNQEFQAKIIKNSGILQKIESEKSASIPYGEMALISLMLSLPLIMCHGFFDYIVTALIDIPGSRSIWNGAKFQSQTHF